MKLKVLFLAAIAAAISMTAFAQTGPWSGNLDVYGSSLTLVFHLDEPCTMDSPDQGIYSVPATLERTATGIKISIPEIGITFQGLYTGKSILGNFTQHGMTFPLTLSPGEPKLNRPQTPVGPFPYNTEEVSFTNGSATLRGTLTLPEGGLAADTPVVIMVTGSGLQNRDEEIFEHKPFAVLADALARNGIASLRYDDRGFGESTGDLVNVTTYDLRDDALAGIELLRTRFSRVGILGHSEGGTIALMLAADGKVDFVISLAGMAVSGARTLIWQNDKLLRAAGYPDSTAKLYCAALQEIYDAAEAADAAGSVDLSGLPAELQQNLEAVRQQLALPYLRNFLKVNVSERRPEISCPVLAFNGTLDLQVSADENLAALHEGLPANSRTRLHEMPGLNHLLQHCTTGSPDEYKRIEETISPEVVEMTVDWIKGL